MSITPSHILEYLYCPRFTYFEYVLRIPQQEQNNFKAMKGREVHDQKLERNKSYLRKKIGVVEKHEDVYLTNDLLRGRIDEVLVLEDGAMAPLDYKFAVYKDVIYETYKTQLYCYAWLIEDNWSTKVTNGYLVYTRSKNKLISVPIGEKDIDSIKKTVDEILMIIEGNHYPKATKIKKRCLNCTYKNICTR